MCTRAVRPGTSPRRSRARASLPRSGAAGGHRAPPPERRCETAPLGSVELQLTQRGPAGVGLALVRVVGRAVQVLAADRAQARAVLAADDLNRQRERQRVAGPGAHVEMPLVEVGRAQLIPAAGLVDLAGVHVHALVGRLEAADARPLEAGGKTQPERVAADGVRDVEPRLHGAALHLVALAAEVERVDGLIEVEAAPLAGREPEPTYVEDVGALRHAIEASVAVPYAARPMSSIR